MKTLLVVEDTPDNRLLLRALLGDMYHLEECDNGVAALASMRDTRPDCVLLDISLPEMDGIEVLRRIRADETIATVPVIALTAHAMIGDRERFLSLGFDDYVTKPIVDENILKRAIERSLAAGS